MIARYYLQYGRKRAATRSTYEQSRTSNAFYSSYARSSVARRGIQVLDGHRYLGGTSSLGVIVKSGVEEIDSSGGLIDVCHLDTIVEFQSSNHLGQIIESS